MESEAWKWKVRSAVILAIRGRMLFLYARLGIRLCCCRFRYDSGMVPIPCCGLREGRETITRNYRSGRSAWQIATAESQQSPGGGHALTNSLLPTDFLDRLVRIRQLCPEMRFGQLMATIGMLAEDETGRNLWDIEDVEFAAAAERFATDLSRREQGSAATVAAATQPHE